MFRQDFTCPALLDSALSVYLYGTVTRYGPAFQHGSSWNSLLMAWSPFARHY